MEFRDQKSSSRAGSKNKRRSAQSACAQGKRRMEYFIQQLLNGLTLGSIYGLIAIGYTMVYGIIGMVNFAHGDVFMIGGMSALMISRQMRWPRRNRLAVAMISIA